MITLYSVSRDAVIKSAVGQGRTNYKFALEKLFPLINKFQEQRKVQRRKFYDRLRNDILKGCQMPPITLAFVDSQNSSNLNTTELELFINDNIDSGYVLDGMQRLNTLNDASKEAEFDEQLVLPINVIVADRYDLLLYRMITLNNGQKPMTARHQIEMLTKGMLDTGDLGISVFSEKDTESIKPPQGSFRRSDIAEAYTAFLTDSVHNQNARIIESKLDEILVGKVMDSDITDANVSFHDILALVSKFSAVASSRDWLRLGNNLIGFTVGAKRSFEYLSNITAAQFDEFIQIFEEAFAAVNVSKINVGKTRRELAKLFFEKIERFSEYDVEAVTEKFHEAILVD
ncbi:MAG: hypothetical protein KKC29_13765 [Alphaproteobacteria bacterium]|nr:hypothetical protein [Alphaproteobacteria bacterium]MBU2040886.1 hypothetical protein [Alphaproteobacteria bacterium]MBU2125962.1 hypothetical protein [Alphaproteobacteria bacterium]MBU2209126.1 hypothetical protein [Alphaproteobacteria bacterium]MBU2292156.1 hypothetical protein [Alphaproteobacteria bacterium]